MKHFYTAILFLLLSTSYSKAQSFTSIVRDSIRDRDTSMVPVQVTGLQNRIDTSFGLSGVCINISHTYTGDLIVWLRSPNGTRVTLIDRVGGGNHNFTATCLIQNAQGALSNASPPFSGTFTPEQSINRFNNGQDPNGQWRLYVADLAGSDTGHIVDFTLTFSPNPPRDQSVSLGNCQATNPVACRCPDGSDTCDLLPDMTASADRMAQDHPININGRELRVGNATPNIGWGPLEVHGTGECYCDTVRVSCSLSQCPDGQPIHEKVVQRVYRRAGDTMSTYDRPAGFMSYHPSHGHVHIENWSQYTLRTRTADANPLNWPVVATGAKVSFCLVNLGDCNSNRGHCRNEADQILTMDSIPNAGFGSLSGCSRSQGIFVGHLDIYSSGLDGQRVPLNGVCDGTYYMVSWTDPTNMVLEQNEDNNVAYSPVTLRNLLPPSAPNFTFTTQGSQVTFNSNDLDPSARFEWDFGDGTKDTLNNPVVHRFLSSGNYSVKLTRRTACGTPASQRIISLVSTLSQFSAWSPEMEAVPNPTSGKAQIRYQLPAGMAASFRLINSVGQQVSQWQERGNGDGLRHEINFASLGLGAGIYQVQMSTPAGPALLKLVVQ